MGSSSSSALSPPSSFWPWPQTSWPIDRDPCYAECASRYPILSEDGSDRQHAASEVNEKNFRGCYRHCDASRKLFTKLMEDRMDFVRWVQNTDRVTFDE